MIDSNEQSVPKSKQRRFVRVGSSTKTELVWTVEIESEHAIGTHLKSSYCKCAVSMGVGVVFGPRQVVFCAAVVCLVCGLCSRGVCSIVSTWVLSLTLLSF